MVDSTLRVGSILTCTRVGSRIIWFRDERIDSIAGRDKRLIAEVHSNNDAKYRFHYDTDRRDSQQWLHESDFASWCKWLSHTISNINLGVLIGLKRRKTVLQRRIQLQCFVGSRVGLVPPNKAPGITIRKVSCCINDRHGYQVRWGNKGTQTQRSATRTCTGRSFVGFA